MLEVAVARVLAAQKLSGHQEGGGEHARLLLDVGNVRRAIFRLLIRLDQLRAAEDGLVA